MENGSGVRAMTTSQSSLSQSSPMVPPLKVIVAAPLGADGANAVFLLNDAAKELV
jgi:hypothetical protein